MSLVVIGGATATGKSAIAVAVALALRERGVTAEVVSADAMQLYRGMDIGTAKITPAERQGVPHHLLDVLDIAEESTAARYRAPARRAIDDILDRGGVALLVGGSGFYLDAVLADRPMPGTDPAIRARIEAETKRLDPAGLRARLAAVDPVAAARIDPRNRRRAIRALEVHAMTGRPFSTFRADPGRPWRPHRLYVVEDDRARLDARIADRVRRMWRDGMIAEVRALLAGGLRGAPTASRATGYPQAIAQIDGVMDEAEAIAATTRATTRLVKKQRTWFRRYPEAVRLRTPAGPGDHAAVDRIVADVLADRAGRDDARPDAADGGDGEDRTR